jgi:hypothetical protein
MREPGASYGQARRPSVRPSRPGANRTAIYGSDLVVPQPPPVTGGQRPLLGRMLPNFTGRPLQAVPPRGAAADESAGTCGADSPLPSGRVQRSNTQHPPTIVTDIPGASCSPPPGTQMSTPNPATNPWVAGRIYAVREPRITARGGTGIATMMRGSHALSGPAPNREPNKRLRATENDDDGIAYGHHCCGSLA